MVTTNVDTLKRGKKDLESVGRALAANQKDLHRLRGELDLAISDPAVSAADWERMRTGESSRLDALLHDEGGFTETARDRLAEAKIHQRKAAKLADAFQPLGYHGDELIAGSRGPGPRGGSNTPPDSCSPSGPSKDTMSSGRAPKRSTSGHTPESGAKTGARAMQSSFRRTLRPFAMAIPIVDLVFQQLDYENSAYTGSRSLDAFLNLTIADIWEIPTAIIHLKRLEIEVQQNNISDYEESAWTIPGWMIGKPGF
jgi:hypothetical protein